MFKLEIFNPVSMILLAIIVVCLVLDIIFKKWYIKIAFAILTTGKIIFSLLYGVPYQQLLIVVLMLIIIELFSYYPRRKEDENAV